MAERENGYCTGCGWHFKNGHRKYCWRVMTMALDVDPTPKCVNWLLREMSMYDRLRSVVYERRKYMYHWHPDNLMPDRTGSALQREAV